MNDSKDISCNNIKVEPYWNVNNSKDDEKEMDIQIKVEPYWNVN